MINLGKQGKDQINLSNYKNKIQGHNKGHANTGISSPFQSKSKEVQHNKHF